MGISITDIRSALRFGGARPTLFRVTITNPITTAGDAQLPFLCQSASIPMWMTGNIRVPYMGRTINIPGDREFQPWNIEVINDEDFVIRNAFETWSNKINTVEGNLRDLPSSESIHYTTTAIVEQLDKRNNVIRKYEFVNAWPAEIGPIQLSWSATDQIETFGVSLMYDSYRVSGSTGDSGGV